MIQCINSNCLNKNSCERYNPNTEGGVNFKNGIRTRGCEYFLSKPEVNNNLKRIIEIQIGKETFKAEEDFWNEPDDN